MRTFFAVLLVLSFLPAFFSPVFAETTEAYIPTVDLKFSGYRFGQEPSANMVCQSGYCKSQAPGGDSLVTFPFSTYGTPGAVTTLSGLTVINPRYTFWENRLYRIFFQVDCTPLELDECVGDIITTLDHEYALTALSSNESRQFVLGRHVITREFVTESGAIVKIRATALGEEAQMPTVNISDKEMANRIGSSLSPNFKPREPVLPEGFRQNRN